jgi:hypothetical protein
MVSAYCLPETYCPNLDHLTSEEVIQHAITTLTSKKEILAASIATLEKRLRFVRMQTGCLTDNVVYERWLELKEKAL